MCAASKHACGSLSLSLSLSPSLRLRLRLRLNLTLTLNHPGPEPEPAQPPVMLLRFFTCTPSQLSVHISCLTLPGRRPHTRYQSTVPVSQCLACRSSMPTI